MSVKRLRSVIQSVGHHGVSGLCYVHPHLGELCKAANLTDAEIDLLSGKVLLEGIEIPRPLDLGAAALAAKFTEILGSESIDREALRVARIQFQFQGQRWPASCYIKVETSDGRTLEDAVSQSGRRAEIVRGSA